MSKQQVYNWFVFIGSILAGIWFIIPASGFHYGFALGAWGIALMYGINFFTKISVTLIFVIMILYMLAGLLNWPLKEGEKVRDLIELTPALLPFFGFIILALLYWENRNRF